MSKKNRVEILENIVKQMLNPIKNIPLYLIIESICGCKIFSYDDFEKDMLMKVIELSAKKSIKRELNLIDPMKLEIMPNHILLKLLNHLI